jgi:molybdopterin-guanine dinucleotide biosynthesis protein A
VADEVVVVLSPDGAEPPLAPDVLFARDPEPFGGPLVGLIAGLGRATHDRVILVGGDMPSLEPAVLRLLLDGLDVADASVLETDAGAGPFPLALRRSGAIATATRLVDAGERRLLSLVEALSAAVVPLTTWTALDPSRRTLRDVDRPSDLVPPSDTPADPA